MRLRILVLLAVILMLAGGGAQALPITYNLSFSDGGGNSLTGFITTDGTLGTITTADLLGWSFNATGVPTFVIGSASGGAPFCFPGSACFDATVSTLSSIGGQAALFSGPLGAVGAVGFFGGPGATLVAWEDNAMTEAQTIVGQDVGAVPEPSTLVLVGSALAALGYGRKRAGQRQSTAV